MIPAERLSSVIMRHEAVTAALAAAPAPEEYVRLSRELAELDEVAGKARALKAAEAELADAEAILDDPASDRELKSLAEEEQATLRRRIETLGEELKLLLLPKDAADERGVILEVRAGTGGDEAALFAGDLFRMYERYAALNRWKVEVLSASEGEVGGYKEIIANISGRGVFARLKFESGVHRVQRVPTTESGGRIHTSAATVAVLPQPEEVDVEIRPEDIRVDTMRASGAGGQHVNTTDSAVRITHLPSGIVVQCQNERSQLQNKARAMAMLKARLAERARLEREEHLEEIRGEKGEAAWGRQVRSYVLQPYQMVKDLRTDHEVGNVQGVLDGDLRGFVEAYLRWRRSAYEAADNSA